jgi:hypothetical protein
MTLLSVHKVVPFPTTAAMVFPRQLLLPEKYSIPGKFSSTNVETNPFGLWAGRTTAILDDHGHVQFGINE